MARSGEEAEAARADTAAAIEATQQPPDKRSSSLPSWAAEAQTSWSRRWNMTHPQSAKDAAPAESWRSWLGQELASFQHAVDGNLGLFRVGCAVVMVASAVAALQRLDHVNEIPPHYFTQRKSIRVRMVRQSHRDPSVFYVYHTPLVRRTVLQDNMPPSNAAPPGGEVSTLLAVRPFGIQVDEGAQEWLWANVVSSHRYMTMQLLRRLTTGGGEADALASCHLSIQKIPLGRDLAHELVARGLAECIPETLEAYADGSNHGSTDSLIRRMKRLEAAQKKAQVMQYGIWKDWQQDKLSDRVLSTGKRVTARGLKKLMGKVTGGGGGGASD